jgi:hypothetical protein
MAPVKARMVRLRIRTYLFSLPGIESPAGPIMSLEHEVRYWTKALGVSEEDARRRIAAGRRLEPCSGLQVARSATGGPEGPSYRWRDSDLQRCRRCSSSSRLQQYIDALRPRLEQLQNSAD